MGYGTLNSHHQLRVDQRRAAVYLVHTILREPVLSQTPSHVHLFVLAHIGAEIT